MGVSAKDSLCLVMFCVCDRACRDLRRHPQPARVQTIDHAGDRLALEVHLLQLQIQRGPKPAQTQIVYLESIELVPMNRDMAQSVVHPPIRLIDADAHQVRHDVGQSVVVVPFHPHDFDAALRIRKLADEAQKFPVFFFQACEIEVGKNVAQQDQPLKPAVLQDQRRLAGMTGLRPQVQVRKDQRVVDRQIHISVVAGDCYGVIKIASKLVHR